MRYQTLGWSCGAASVVNALLALGVRTSERRARKAAGTDETGTGEPGIIAALRQFGLTVHELHEKNPSVAWGWLHGCLKNGRPVILSTDRWWHWVVTVGTLGERVVLVDCTRTAWNTRENGTHLLGRSQLLRRWRGPGAGTYYGISAGRS